MRVLRRPNPRSRGMTLVELLVAMVIMGMVAYSTALIYFSELNLYSKRAWAMPPFDEATAAVKRLNKEVRGAMLIHDHSDTSMVTINPLTDANRDNVLTLGTNGYYLTQGDMVAFYLSDSTGSLTANGNCLWKAVKSPSATSFTPRVLIAENIHPELNPVDPDTGLPRPMFKYWPDDVRLWGVEVWVTSVAVVRGETKTQTVHSEIYLRNL